MNQTAIAAIKWTLVVLLAGFIGYFGKHLAKLIINQFKKEKPEPKNITINMPGDESTKYKYKLEKKKLKLEKGRLKLEEAKMKQREKKKNK